ncbi:flagellar assembly protein FliH [Paludibacterium denitrificans]|uniref:Flagellar assembly protein FliH n=1 Tax=Paludibacterium denitrificans TaxID=2675226 RepID=A0A844GDV3_9NEIS|nr:flagellar assembly protein FliH [Paludibacterium denitrificans]MTD32924.1 flagellar assembly protein H [Paludibacterium denitrificans]
MTPFRPYRFPPLSKPEPTGAAPGDAAQWQASLAKGFKQGMDTGYREGYDSGVAAGHKEGFDKGYTDGLKQAADEAKGEVAAAIEELARPLDAMLANLRTLQADYQAAMHKEVIELVGKVARRVIRCELALQPVQLLSLVDETLATMPVVNGEVEVYLNPEECQRLHELAPERAARWSLIPDSSLEAGECRVKSGNHEADACRQRLESCMEQVKEQLHAPASAPDGKEHA